MKKIFLFLSLLVSGVLVGADTSKEDEKWLKVMLLKDKYCDVFKGTVLLWSASSDKQKATAARELCKLQLNSDYVMNTESIDLLKAENLLDKNGKIPFDINKFESFKKRLMAKK